MDISKDTFEVKEVEGSTKMEDYKKETIDNLSPKDIEEISGGRIRREPLRAGESWVLYDDRTIKPIGRYNTKEEAVYNAISSKNSTEQLSTLFGGFTLKRLRKDAANGNRDCVNKDFSKKEKTSSDNSYSW